MQASNPDAAIFRSVFRSSSSPHGNHLQQNSVRTLPFERTSHLSVYSGEPTAYIASAPSDQVKLQHTEQAFSPPSSEPIQGSTTSPASGTTHKTSTNPFDDSVARDALMTYAYHLYQSSSRPSPGLTPVPIFAAPVAPVSMPDDIYRDHLLPLLSTLRALHPKHLPILLLLACTYHNLGDFDNSLALSEEMLVIDPKYVEAMCNMGTTVKAMGHNDKAYEWWWKALQIRPMYWDVMDNIIGMLFAFAQHAHEEAQRLSFHAHALKICQFVQQAVVANDGRLVLPVPAGELHRLQKVYFTSATISSLIHPTDTKTVLLDHFRSIELVIRPPSPYTDAECYTARDLILGMCVAGYILCATAITPIPQEITESLTVQGQRPFPMRLLDPGFNLINAVRIAGDQLLAALLRLGEGTLTVHLLLPEEVARLSAILFPQTSGVIPAICTRQEDVIELPSEAVRQQTNLMTSTVLLTLAKYFQNSNTFTPEGILGLAGIPNPSRIPLAILLYYLSLSLAPTPSTYNNLGIILSSVAATRLISDAYGGQQVLNGTETARLYYCAGLNLDRTHPHLLTNMGSLLKDQGRIDSAIQLYMEAVDHKPDFDIALANLGNAIKDAGRAWDAIPYYKRAAEVNPDLPEATCGLANSLCSVCDWRGRGGLAFEMSVDEDGNALPPGSTHAGWMTRLVETCERQLELSYSEGHGTLLAAASVEEWLRVIERTKGRQLGHDERQIWMERITRFRGMSEEQVNEAGFLLRLLDWVLPRLMRQLYIRAYGVALLTEGAAAEPSEDLCALFEWPAIPGALTLPPVPSVLPFHTFTYPLPSRLIRLIAHRNALRVTYIAHTQGWARRRVHRPPRPPVNGKLNIGYVSNDINNHPLSHLMYSVFAMHDRSRFNVFLYTTSPWDGSAYRQKISRDVDHFIDASSWPNEAIVESIIHHDIHILINLGGYTKGSRNEIFAARPCPVQLQLMGYAGTLGAGWCDYLVCDPISCPPETCASERWRKRMDEGISSSSLDLDADLDPESSLDDWIYTEKFIYMPYTFMVTDHKQSFRNDEYLTPEDRAKTHPEALWQDEEVRRAEMRRRIFPDIPQDTVIFANFNQMYKIDPGILAVWLRILARVPRSILWLLRFPAAGEEHIVRTAKAWAGEEVASRIRFTDVVKKDEHIYRARVADLCLDTLECNAHTITADVLWTGTPILTCPRHPQKMCSRVAASMANATGFGEQMVVKDIQEYEDRAVAYALSLHYEFVEDPPGTVVLRGRGPLTELRRNIFLNRDVMPLFDTQRWTRNFEKGVWEAWRRWVMGTQFEMSDEWNACQGTEKTSGCIWVPDEDPVHVVRY